MIEPLTSQELAVLDRGLALGTRREAPAVPERLRRDDAPELTALAFAAQQRRLTRGTPTGRLDGFDPPDDPRPTVPEACRPALRRLVASARLHRLPGLLRAVAWLLRERGARLHPFDTDAMALDEMAPCAGPYEAWVATRTGRIGTVIPAGADDTTWVDLPPAARLAWLRERRASDPDVARGLLEGVWGGERAEVRLHLLEALIVRLGPSDLPFLKRLAADRSAKVKSVATRLAGAVPGTPEYAARLALAAGALKIERARVVGRQTLTVARGTDLERTAEILAGIDPHALIEALGVDAGVFARIGDAASDLMDALSVGALRFRRFEVLDAVLAQALARGRAPFGPAWLEILQDLPPADRQRALRAAVDGPLPLAVARDPAVAEAWTSLLDGPLPASGSARMRQTAEFGALLARCTDADAMTAATRELAGLAVLVAPSDAGAAHAQLAAYGPVAAPVVQLLWRLVADLDATLPPRMSP